MSRRSEGLLGAAVLIVGLGLAALAIWMFGAQWWHGIWSFARHLVPPVLAGFGVAIVIFALMHRVPEVAVGLGVALGILAFAVTAFVSSGYIIPHQVADEVEVVEAEDLDFRQRVPYDVAAAVSDRNLGATTGTATGVIKATPAAGDYGVYTTSVIRRGMFQGYETVQTMTPPLYGATSAQNVEFCEFSEDAKLRFGGMVPSNNLKRAIMWNTSPSTKVDQNDAVTRCEDGVPMIYAPLTKLDGNVFFPKRVPGGVAVYNGETGELVIEDEIYTDLPLYPNSVAENQREALTRTGSIFDWIFKRTGYEDTSKDEEDPNGENRAEFGLANAEGDTQYFVTPLTSRGSTSSIIALGTVQSDGKVTAGELRPYTVHTYDPALQANSAIASRITGEVLSGYMASGLTVFEVVPSEDGTWTATVGKEQTVLYRAVIHPNGEIDLLDSAGRDISSDGPVESEGAESPDLSAEKPLEEMNVEELQQLGDQILEELASRSHVE